MDRRHARADGGRRARDERRRSRSTSGRRCARGAARSPTSMVRRARLASSLRARGVGAGDVVVFQLPNWVEAGITFWAAAYLGATVVPIVHFYGAKEVDYILRAVEPDVIVTADRFGHADHLATYAELLAGSDTPPWLVVGDTPAASLPAGATPFARPARRRPAARTHRRGPGPARRHRLHVGHHQQPEGRRPLAPHDRLRDAPARADVPAGRPAADHRRAGRPLHRDGQRVPRAAAPRPPREPRGRVGPGRGAAPHARGGPRHGRRRDVLPHQPARPSRLQRGGAPPPDALRRPGRFDRARRRHGAGRPPRHPGVPVLRQHRAPVDHRLLAR